MSEGLQRMTLAGNQDHRVCSDAAIDLVAGSVRFSCKKASWLAAMLAGTLIGGALTFSWFAFLVWLVTTATVLLLGHSLGSHRKLIHDSFQCPRWLEYLLVWFGVQVGLAGPISLLRQHELRDYAQRQPVCHDYLRHGRSFWTDAWWQLCCELHLEAAPRITIEARIADDAFFRMLERTWMLQQVVPGLLLYASGGMGFVFWGVCARVSAGVVGHWLIGHLAHNRGQMHYTVRGAAVQGRNVRCLALVTMGESWHNNHHAFPGSARLGLGAGEWDPGWWVLCALRRCGLVWNIRTQDDLPPRVELEAFDTFARLSGQRSDSRAAPSSIRPAWRTCATTPRADERDAWFIEGPAAHLSRRVLTFLIGPTVPFRHAPEAPRLSLRRADEALYGLPVICAVLCWRTGPWRTLGVCLAPFAILAESLRRALTFEDGPPADAV